MSRTDSPAGLTAVAGSPRPAGGPAPLSLVEELCAALRTAGVSYCHWKSNDMLHLSASGVNDLDLLVDRRDLPRFLAVLAACGFKQARPQRRGRQVPGVVHYYGLDAADRQAGPRRRPGPAGPRRRHDQERAPADRARLPGLVHAGAALPRPGAGVRARGARRAAGPQARHLGRRRVRAGAAARRGAPGARVPRRTGRSGPPATGRGGPPAADRLGRLVAVLPRTAGRRAPPHAPGGRARRRPRRRRPDAPPPAVDTALRCGRRVEWGVRHVALGQRNTKRLVAGAASSPSSAATARASPPW